MTLKQLRWVAFLIPVVFLVTLEIVRYSVLERFLPLASAHGIAIVAMLTGVLIFSTLIFHVIEDLHARVVGQNKEFALLNEKEKRHAAQLQALNEAGVGITSELTLDNVLQKVVDLSRELGQAQYGALAVLGEDGKIEKFVTSAIAEEDRRKIGHPPTGRGLLGSVLTQKKAIRLADISQDSRSTGFPPNHPAMKSFLGVAIRYKGRTLGNLYLTNKRDAEEFALEDEETIGMFATQAAVAIENARLYERVQSLAVLEERDRIGKDLHDSTIQSLYALGLNLEDCAEIVNDKPREVKDRLELAIDSLNDVVRDIRNYIMDLRPHLLGRRTLRQGLSDLVAEFQVNTLIDVDFNYHLDDNTFTLSQDRTVNLLMVVREGLTNVLKHAQARHVELGLSHFGTGIKMWIQDDGKGFDTIASRSSERQGISNMSERAKAMGGNLEIQSVAEHGTRIELIVPTTPQTVLTSQSKEKLNENFDNR